ncbi:MAG: hypothetical protein RSD97_02895 [Lachnospiraceae bacterium]
MKKPAIITTGKRIGAWLLCVILICGLFPVYPKSVQAISNESNVYTALELTLTKAQKNYDLTTDITYDVTKYSLSITDEGGFSIDMAGDYVVAYLLSPIIPDPIPQTEAIPVQPIQPVPTNSESQPTAVAFTRVVHVVESNIHISFTIDPADVHGSMVAFTNGTTGIDLEISTGSCILADKIPAVKLLNTGEMVPVIGWLHSASGMTYTTEQLTTTSFQKEEAFVAVIQTVKQDVCTCGAGDASEFHSSGCALLHQPENKAIYTKKAGGTLVSAPMGPSPGARSAGITVPKGMFFLSPSPNQGNAPGSYDWYDTFEATIRAINGNTGSNLNKFDYRIIICKAEQELTATDVGKNSTFHSLGGTFVGKGGNVPTDNKAKSLTLSASWSDPDGADTLWDRNPATWGANTQLGLQGAPDDAGTIILPGQVDLGVPTTFRNMNINRAGGNPNVLINAYSQKVIMGEGVENIGGSYIDLFGKTGDPEDSLLYDGGTELEVFSGTYHQVCGGYYNAQDQDIDASQIVTGNKNVKLYGGNYRAGANGNTTNILDCNYVVADSIDDDVDGGGRTDRGGKPIEYSTEGTVSMLVQPMEGLTFVAPPAILLGIYSCSLFPSGEDTITLDTTYYKQPIDMSQTDIAAAPDGEWRNSWPVSGTDGNHTSVRMDINAPQTTLKSLWGRAMTATNTTNYPTVINLNDIGTVTEYISGSQRSTNAKYYENDNTVLNINKSVQLNGVRWFSKVNIAENMDLSVNHFEMVLDHTISDAGAEREMGLHPYMTSGFPLLLLKNNSALNVSKGGGNCTFGNITAGNSSRISLSCDNYMTNDQAGGILFGKITANGVPNQLQIGLSPNTLPLASGSYGYLYLGNNSTNATAKIGPLANLASSNGEIRHIANGQKRFLSIGTNTQLPIEVSSPSTTSGISCGNFQEVAAAISRANKPGEVFKVRILKPYLMTAADYTDLSGITTTQCAGLIFTGWTGDFGYEPKGDGYQSSGESTVDKPEPIGQAGAGQSTPYKNIAPPSTNGITLLANDIQLAVPSTFRNISLRSTVGTPISYKAMSGTQTNGSLQIGPGLEQDTTSYMNVYGGRTNFTGADNYHSAVTIYNGKYATVLSDVHAGTKLQSNTGTSALYIYGGIFGAGTADSNIISTTMSDPNSTNQHGGGKGRKSEIHLFMSGEYNFHLNNSPVIGDAYGQAVNLGSSIITIENESGTAFEHFPMVSSIDTMYSGAQLNGGTVLDIKAKNCTFGTVTPGNGNGTGPLLTSGTNALALNIYASKSIDSVYGGGTAPSTPVNVTPRVCAIKFKGGCSTTVKNTLSNWSTLTLEKGTVTPTQVFFDGPTDTFYAANAGASAKVGTLWLQDNTQLQLKNPQNRYGGIYELKGNKTTGNCGTLLVHGTSVTPGLTIREQFIDPMLYIGLTPGVSIEEGTKLLQFQKPASAMKGDYYKHTSIVASVIKDTTDGMPNGTLPGHGYVFLNRNASVRVYPAPHNGAPGADPMRYTDYITLYDALVDMEQYPGPKGEKYLVNFIQDYTIGYHNKLGTLETADGTGITDDLKKLKEFQGEAPGAGRIRSISFSSIDQNKPELLTENDMKKLNTVNIQTNAAYGSALHLPEKPDLAFHAGNANQNDGIIFESFLFGSQCPPVIAANGCNTTMGASGAENGQPGSVRMTNDNLTLYGGSISGPSIAAAHLVINSGTYQRVQAGGSAVANQVTGNAVIDINGGISRTVAGIDTGGVATVNFNQSITVDTITQFDEINVNKKLTIRNDMSSYDAGRINYVGNLTLADNAVLEFQNANTGAVFVAGNLVTGTNSVLFVPKATAPGSLSLPLKVAGTYTSRATGNGKLITDVKSSNIRAKGDDLIVFETAAPLPDLFFSTSMNIGQDGALPNYIIEYGLPKNPATKLAWVGMNTPETGSAHSKDLYFDSLIYDPNNLNNDGLSKVSNLFLLNQKQYTDFMAATDKRMSIAMTTGKYSKTTAAFTEKENAPPATPDGIGDGIHTHYYSKITSINISPEDSYYTLTYAGDAWAIAVLDVYAPDASTAGKKPKAVRGDGIGSEKKLTLNIPLEELGQGAHTPSGIYRMGWSGQKQFTSNVTEPDHSSLYPVGAFSPMPVKGDWTQGNSSSYLTTMQDVKPAPAGGIQGNTVTYQMTVTKAQAETIPSFYLYVQDTMGNTREVTITPDWQFAADITYLPGSSSGIPVPGDPVYDKNIPYNSSVEALPCPKTFVPTNNYAFAGWLVTAGHVDILNKTYYAVTDKFKVAQDTTLTAQWKPDENKDGVPDEWQRKIQFHIASANLANASFTGDKKEITIALPQLNPDGTYTNGYRPGAAPTTPITIASKDVPETVPNTSYKFTYWTEGDTGTTPVNPVGKELLPSTTVQHYYAHFESKVTAIPQLKHTGVVQNTLPENTAQTPNKTLRFDFALREAASGAGLGNTEIVRGFITKSPDWTYGTSDPTDLLPITLGGGAANTIWGTMNGTVTGDISDADIWYAYVVTNGNKVGKIVLDTTGVTYTNTTGNATGGLISQKNQNPDHTIAPGTTVVSNVTATMTLEDPIKTGMPSGITYTASGRNKAGWTTTKLADGDRAILCQTNGWETLRTQNKLDLFTDGLASVSATPVSSDRIFLYTADVMGNIRETTVVLTPIYNVSVPTWIGLAAIQGQTNKLITPTKGCYIVNQGTQGVIAKITNFTVKQGASNHLRLVSAAPTVKEEMQLTIKEQTSTLGFPDTRAAGITAAAPLSLGTIPGSSQTHHGVGFTFSAVYLKEIPLRLNDWDLFTMSYQFAVGP